jgi:hypothetical protein
MTIARLEKLDLRVLWKHEAHGFTRWLAENLDFISETIGFDLSLVEREASAGPFSADILAEDSQGHPVVIENQLEQTDHDHLGKLITYMSNLDARTAIWITRSPRPEHEKAVHWLNETLPADTAFYLLKVEAYKIGDSDPAPLLTIVAGPSLESKQVGGQKKELAERHLLRREFWTQLLDAAKSKTRLFDRISPGTDNWVGASAGKSGMAYNFVIRMQDAQVELYIDRGKTEENKRIFDALFSKKAEVEERFGTTLEWQRLDNRQSCRIRFLIEGLGLENREKWPKLQEQLIDAMIRFHKALQPLVQAVIIHE